MGRFAAVAAACVVVTGSTKGQASAQEAQGNVDLSARFSEAFTHGPLAADRAVPVTEPDLPPYVYDDGPYVVGYLSSGGIVTSDFDGGTIVTDPDMTEGLLLTEFDPGFGIAVGLGYRFNEFAIELYYERMQFDTNFADADFDDAVMQSINLDVKYYLATDSALQPHVQVGFVLPWLDIHGAGFAPLPPSPVSSIGDVELRGFGFTVGAGLTYYVTPQVAIIGTAGVRLVWYNRMEGVSGQELRPHTGTYDGSGTFLRAGVAFSF